MSIAAPALYWERLRGGRRHFAWNEPRAFRKQRLLAEWRRVQSSFLTRLLGLTPALIFVGCWVRDRIADEPFHPGRALLASVALPGAFGLWAWLETGPWFRIELRDDWISWANGRHFHRWEALRGFAFLPQAGFAVLALEPRQGPPVFLGVPPSVAREELIGFLRGRGLEERFDGAPLPPHFAAAKQ